MARLNAILIGLAALGCTLCAAPLRAATHPVVVQFIPAQPVAGDTVTARLSNGLSKACWPPATSIVRDGGNVTIQLDYDDACPPQYIMPFRDYELGSFPAANYTLIVRSCSNNPPPFPSECNIVLQAPFSVLAPRPPVEPAPALSLWVMLALMAGLVAVTAVQARTVRCRRKN